jgi:hypothetical protein
MSSAGALPSVIALRRWLAKPSLCISRLLPDDKFSKRLSWLSSLWGLSNPELEQIAADAELIEIRRANLVYASGDAAGHVFIVLSGIVKQVGNAADPVLHLFLSIN